MVNNKTTKVAKQKFRLNKKYDIQRISTVNILNPNVCYVPNGMKNQK